MGNILSSLTPKGILFNVLKEKLDDTGIQKIVLVFCVENDKYNVMLSNHLGKSMHIDITEDEITTLKKLFIRRIVARWNERYDDDIRDVIIEVDLVTESFNIFIQTPTDKVLKFDY